MKTLKELFKTRDKKIVLYLGALLAVGVLLMLTSGLPAFFKASPDGTDNAASGSVTAVINGETAAVAFTRERSIEKRLEEVLSLVADVGRVKAMVSLTPEKETVYAADVNASETLTKEQDAQGGSRETSTRTKQDKTILITDKAGVDRPLVLREIEPRIAGVIIIAEGGDSVFVKDALTKAACTVLGVEANKVQIFKMKGE